ncbi:DivIVA domain-containing protein [Luteimicrobium subarcticum]|uniref:DivIVA domain-containing protein n=1 Tax=Luteimicrobium subarcticum TaxID=620910 RepID=A0A2M8WU14_9MICO|nr:DivIVA domain-containing protein [Luteimicrobium subarcticum]PJI94420.1 DivIVA domain-containing protein [Luteimicrobium subarcticum]
MSRFSTVSKVHTGYDPDEVDDFFEFAREVYEGRRSEEFGGADIQAVSFELIRGGYDTHEVDAALDRLETAFSVRVRSNFVASNGPQAWMEKIADDAKSLYPRLNRPTCEKFAPAGRGEAGYDMDEVDALCDRLVDYFDRQVPLSASEVRGATFRRRRGKDAYAEGPVDAYLARAVEVLLGVE